MNWIYAWFWPSSPGALATEGLNLISKKGPYKPEFASFRVKRCPGAHDTFVTKWKEEKAGISHQEWDFDLVPERVPCPIVIFFFFLDFKHTEIMKI